MAKTLLINLMSSIDRDNLASTNIQKYYDAVKDEYLKIQNKDIYIFIVSLSYNVITLKSDITVQSKVGNQFLDFKIPTMTGDLGNPEILTGIFKKITDATQDADNNVLVSWGHGMGYSMFWYISPGDEMRDMSLILPSRFSELLKFDNSTYGKHISVREPLFSTMSDFSFERSPFSESTLKSDVKVNLPKPDISALTINELLMAIKGSKLNLDMVILDNCFMQTIDTVYTLKDNTRYLIAPQTGFPWRGFFYGFFDTLNSKIDDDFCRKFCDTSFTELQKSDLAVDVFQSKDVSFSCIKMANINPFAESLLQIAQFFRDNYNYLDENDNFPVAEAIYNAVCDSTDLSAKAYAINLIDIKSFLIRYNERIKISVPDFEGPFKNLLALYNSVVISNNAGAEYKTESSGLSILFPPNHKTLGDNPFYKYFEKENAQVESTFAKITGWGTFLETFLNLLRPRLD
jgi:hypothetical protein